MDKFRALLVTKDGNRQNVAITELTDADLMAGDVTVAVEHSTVNYKVEEVRLEADNEGHEVVNVQGWVRRLWSAPFNYSLALKLRIASEPGHPEDVILIEPSRAGVTTGGNLGDLRLLLDRAIVDGVKQALEVAIRHIASLQHLIRGTDFPATLVSLTSLTVVPSHWDPSISMLVHGGTISGIAEEVIARD